MHTEVVTGMNHILKKLRKEHRYTQEDLAVKLHVSRQTISNWETGRTTPDIHSIKLLTDIYGSDLLTIFDANDPEPHSDEHPIIQNEAVKNDRLTNFFVIFLNFISMFIPLAAILSLYIVMQWREKIPAILFKISCGYLTIISSINVFVLIAVPIYFST